MPNIKKEKSVAKKAVSVSLNLQQIKFLEELDKKHGGTGSVSHGIEKMLKILGFAETVKR